MRNLDSMAGAAQATFLPPSVEVSNPVGFVAPAIVQSNYPLEVKRIMAEVAEMLVHDPIAIRQFCDRIHELLRDDIEGQQERSCGRRH